MDTHKKHQLPAAWEEESGERCGGGGKEAERTKKGIGDRLRVAISPHAWPSVIAWMGPQRVGRGAEARGGCVAAEKWVSVINDPKYLKAAITYEDIQRIETFPVPAAALREAILNALVHRDYAVPAPVQIRVYRDKLSIWNPAVLPEGWTLDHLRGPHSSRPHNPVVANAFFRAGEIEAWGRGIQRIFDACATANTPNPKLTLQGSDLWLEFPFSEAYLAAVDSENSEETTPDSNPDASGKTSGKILAAVMANPQVTIPELAALTGVTERSVERNLQKLQAENRLRRIGPAKGGHWEVIEMGGNG